MTAEQRRDAVGRLPLHPPGSFVGALHTAGGLYAALVGVGGAVAVIVWFAVQHEGIAIAALLGIPLSWPMRRCYQWLPTAQQMTVLVDPDGWVRVVLGRGAVLPSARRVGRVHGSDDVARGTVAGCLVGLLAPLALTGLAFGSAALIGTPLPALALVSAFVWLLVELVLRILHVNTLLSRGWRLGTPRLGAYVVVWRSLEGAVGRRGVGADRLLEAVSGRGRDVRDALAIVRPLLEVQPPRR